MGGYDAGRVLRWGVQWRVRKHFTSVIAIESRYQLVGLRETPEKNRTVKCVQGLALK